MEGTDPLRSFYSQGILGKCSTPLLPNNPFSATISTDFYLTDYLIEVWGFLNSLDIFFFLMGVYVWMCTWELVCIVYILICVCAHDCVETKGQLQVSSSTTSRLTFWDGISQYSQRLSVQPVWQANTLQILFFPPAHISTSDYSTCCTWFYVSTRIWTQFLMLAQQPFYPLNILLDPILTFTFLSEVNSDHWSLKIMSVCTFF